MVRLWLDLIFKVLMNLSNSVLSVQYCNYIFEDISWIGNNSNKKLTKDLIISFWGLYYGNRSESWFLLAIALHVFIAHKVEQYHHPHRPEHNNSRPQNLSEYFIIKFKFIRSNKFKDFFKLFLQNSMSADVFHWIFLVIG